MFVTQVAVEQLKQQVQLRKSCNKTDLQGYSLCGDADLLISNFMIRQRPHLMQAVVLRVVQKRLTDLSCTQAVSHIVNLLSLVQTCNSKPNNTHAAYADT